MAKLNSFKVSINLPYIGGIEGSWTPDETEKKAAWEMYVELITRVSVVQLDPESGLLRDALTSMYSLFDTTRKILRSYGPDVARPKGNGNISFGSLAVSVLNSVLRPLLSKWHSMLKDYEDQKPDGISSVAYERNWERQAELRQDIDATRTKLVEYANILAEVAEVPSLITSSPRQ